MGAAVAAALSLGSCGASWVDGRTAASPSNGPTVATATGLVQGYYETVEGVTVAAFRGIPYVVRACACAHVRVCAEL